MTGHPVELDGAVVLHVTVARHNDSFGFVHFADENRDEPIEALAVCQYPGNDEVYVFACSEDWTVIGDLCYDSVENAKADAERFYETGPIEWTAVGTITEETAKLAAEEEAKRVAAFPDDYASDDTLRALRRDGLAIDAIRRLRLAKDLGLLEAKQYVEGLDDD